MIGYIYNGIFEGRIHISDKDNKPHLFAVEASKRFMVNEPEQQAFHSVIYDADDVIHEDGNNGASQNKPIGRLKNNNHCHGVTFCF